MTKFCISVYTAYKQHTIITQLNNDNYVSYCLSRFRLDLKIARDYCDMFSLSEQRGKYKNMKKMSRFRFPYNANGKVIEEKFHFSSCTLLNAIRGKQQQNATLFRRKPILIHPFHVLDVSAFACVCTFHVSNCAQSLSYPVQPTLVKTLRAQRILAEDFWQTMFQITSFV